MGCNGCSSSSGGGCGTSGGGCGVCHGKLPVFNWLSGVQNPNLNIIEVSFKNGRKEFFRNENKLMMQVGDIVCVEGAPGHDVGIVSLVGDIVRLQMRRKGISRKDESIKKIYRKASQADIEKWEIARGREHETMHQTRLMALDLGLEMKITDVEFQGDNTKATFYYTANARVDFRELIKVMATDFKIRIEMRQIGARQESARLGGIGSCGRELCCSSWLSDFRSVNTSAARYQQLSLNPQKLAGQCGKLKCCLNFELESYLDALQHFPSTQQPLFTKAGKAYSQKVDIFGGKILYCVKEDIMTHWFELPIEEVKEIIAMNKKGIQPDSLEDYAIVKEEDASLTFENVVGQDSLTRFDTQKKDRNKNRNRHKRKPSNNRSNNRNQKGKSASANGEKSNKNKQGQSNVVKKRPNKNGGNNKNSKKPISKEEHQKRIATMLDKMGDQEKTEVENRKPNRAKPKRKPRNYRKPKDKKE